MYDGFVVGQLQKYHVFISVNASCKAFTTTIPVRYHCSIYAEYAVCGHKLWGHHQHPTPWKQVLRRWLKFCDLDCFDGRLRLWNNTHDESCTLRPGTCVKKANRVNCDFMLTESVTQSTGHSQKHSGKQHICAPALFVFHRREHEATFLKGNFSLTSSSF